MCFQRQHKLSRERGVGEIRAGQCDEEGEGVVMRGEARGDGEEERESWGQEQQRLKQGVQRPCKAAAVVAV